MSDIDDLLLREYDTYSYPPIPKHTGKFYGINGKHYGYSVPQSIDKWEWSYTFNKWGAFVTQADGTKVYTYPEVKNV